MTYSTFSVLYLGLLGALCAVGAASYLNIPFQPDIFPVAFGLIASVYFFNRYTDVKEDFINEKIKPQQSLNRKNFIITGSIFAITTILYLVISTKPVWYIATLLGIGILYSFPLIPTIKEKKLSFCSLKKIPLGKNLLVSGLWSLSIFLVPSALADKPIVWTSTLIVMLGAIFISSFANTLFNDILGVVGDRAAGIKTLPVINIDLAEWVLKLCMMILLLSPMATLLLFKNIIEPSIILLLAIVAMFNYVSYHYKVFPNRVLAITSEIDLVVIFLGLMLAGCLK
jgi:4-hydroxybenzoate polyprenyltransferase